MGAPSRHLLLRHGDSYAGAAAGGFANFSFEYFRQHKHSSSLIHPAVVLMAEDGGSSSSNAVQPGKETDLREAALENAAAEGQRDWLQLGVGSAAPAPARSAMELQLFPERPAAAASTSYGPAADRVGRSGNELRVVGQPQRARPGVWLALRPAENQVNEPFLPQLTKSFLRIKNERMTIRLLMRYLANKLGLHDESEVEITCRRQQLLPYATLEDVRNQIWCAGASEAPGPASPGLDHVMKLYYSRRA